MIKTAADGAVAEAEKSQTVILALDEFRKEVGVLAEASQSIAAAAVQAEVAAREAQKGAEIISSAAEEQAAAAAECAAKRGAADVRAGRKPERHAIPCRDGERLGTLSKGDARADQLASAAEQMSTAIQEISGAANQIMVRGRADQPRRAAAVSGDAGSERGH